MADDLTITLSAYPFVVIRLQCDVCKRAGQYRLARLAATFGAETSAMAVLLSLTEDCPWRFDRAHKRMMGLGHCGVFLPDLRNKNPPDLPPGLMGLRLVAGGDR